MISPSSELEHLWDAMFDPSGVDAVLLLGAGASHASGIPLSREIVLLAAQWMFDRRQSETTHSSVEEDKWASLLYSQSWFDRTVPIEDNYSAVVENLLQPPEVRRQFFQHILRSASSPSDGYHHLADLMRNGVIRTVLTTNFDDLLVNAFHTLDRKGDGLRKPIAIRTTDDYKIFSTYPLDPQIFYLHGSVDHYTDRNVLSETMSLGNGVPDLLLPLLRDHPLVVIGYRGAEASIVKSLLLDQFELANHFRRGIYWCVRDNNLSHLHPGVRELADRLGSCFQLIGISGFDEVMARASARYHDRMRFLDPMATVGVLAQLFSVEELERFKSILKSSLYASYKIRAGGRQRAAETLERVGALERDPHEGSRFLGYCLTEKGRNILSIVSISGWHSR